MTLHNIPLFPANICEAIRCRRQTSLAKKRRGKTKVGKVSPYISERAAAAAAAESELNPRNVISQISAQSTDMPGIKRNGGKGGKRACVVWWVTFQAQEKKPKNCVDDRFPNFPFLFFAQKEKKVAIEIFSAFSPMNCSIWNEISLHAPFNREL